MTIDIREPVDLTKPRLCGNWLKSLSLYVEDTESPRSFWLWSGIFTLAATLQRRVWIPRALGLDSAYPNLYILIVAPPGEYRKGPPVSFAKQILRDIKIPVFADSPTKRALTQALAELNKTQWFYLYDERGVKVPKTHCSIALISKELSSFLAVDAKAMIECLTDIYDPHEEWEYKTSGVGADKLHGVCTSCLLASTPAWIGNNLPEDAIGGGFTSRTIIVTADDKYRWIALSEAPDLELYNKLRLDLLRIRQLTGEFQWHPEARSYYVEWYPSLKDLTLECRDSRLKPFIARMHAVVLKVAMCLHVARSDELILEPCDIGQAIDLVMSVYATAGPALGGHGRSKNSVEVETVLSQLRLLKRASFSELLKMNFRNTSKRELEEVLETIVSMGAARCEVSAAGIAFYSFLGSGARPSQRADTTRWGAGLSKL